MDIRPLNQDACNFEETRAALKTANANFKALKAAVEKVVADVEEIKRSWPRPT